MSTLAVVPASALKTNAPLDICVPDLHCSFVGYFGVVLKNCFCCCAVDVFFVYLDVCLVVVGPATPSEQVP